MTILKFPESNINPVSIIQFTLDYKHDFSVVKKEGLFEWSTERVVLPLDTMRGKGCGEVVGSQSVGVFTSSPEQEALIFPRHRDDSL